MVQLLNTTYTHNNTQTSGIYERKTNMRYRGSKNEIRRNWRRRKRRGKGEGVGDEKENHFSSIKHSNSDT